MKDDEKIYVTRPMLPGLDSLWGMLEDIWLRKHVTNFGHYHNQLEERLSALLAAPNFSLFANGTLGLLLALRALELKGEVIVTPFTFPATVTCLEWCGLTPVYCDIDEETLCLNPDHIEGLITDRTSAILGVHVYGILCDVHKIQAIADQHGLKVVYDAAHAFMSTAGGEAVAGFGDAVMFSLHATKLFHTIEGGGVAFKDAAVKEKADMMRDFGLKEGVPFVSGINAKMNELQAAVGLANLEILGEERRKRAMVKEAYDKILSSVPGIKTYGPVASESLQYYPITVDPDVLGIDRDELFQVFADRNIFTRKYFSPLCSEYPYMKSRPEVIRMPLPVAETIVRQVLCLPFYGDLLGSDLGRIESVLKPFAMAAR